MSALWTHMNATYSSDHTSDSVAIAGIARRSKITMAGLAAVALLATGCSAAAERATEYAYERAIESSTGDDVDLDLDFSDGSFSVETADGSFAIDENGNFVVESDEGTFTGQADDDGFTVTGEDGEVFEMSASGAGGMLGEFDTSELDATSQDWSKWPSDLPRLDGYTDIDVTWVGDGTSYFSTALGHTTASPADAVDAYTALVSIDEDLGRGEYGTSVSQSMVVGANTVNVSADLVGDLTQLLVVVMPNG